MDKTYNDHVIDVVRTYEKTWNVLLSYDENQLSSLENKSLVQLTYEEALSSIETLRKEIAAPSLFGRERDRALEAILGNLDQTFDNIPLYSSYEEKASHLLYFVIKDHPFSDGNKRIGCLLFLLYLHKSGHDLSCISNNTLIALALLVAESDPSQKSLTVELIKSLIR